MAHFISSTSMRYMCGMTWTGMLTRRSQKMKPTWLEDARPALPRRFWSVEWRGTLFADLAREYSMNAFMDG